ncbi:MAG: YbaK/EbsC family protein [Gemmataceae bacterium]
MRVTDFLTQHQVPFQSLTHAPAYCAGRRAKFLHTPGDAVAKAVLLATPNGYVIVVVPATRHVDLGRFPGARLATPEEMVRVFTDCEYGAVTPFGNLYGLPTYLDESFTQDTWIVVEAGTHTDAVRLSARDFARLANCERGRFARVG